MAAKVLSYIKNNWSKSIYFVLCIVLGAIIQKFILPEPLEYLDKLIYGEPKINLNVFEFSEIDEPKILPEYDALFITKSNRAWIFYVSRGNIDLTLLFHKIPIPINFLNFKPSEKLYVFGVYNFGNGSAKNVKIEFKSDNLLKELYKDDNVNFSDCSGFENYSCIYEIENIPPDKIRDFYIKSVGSPIKDTSCSGDFYESCKQNKIDISFAEITSALIGTETGKIIPTPALSKDDQLLVYQFNPKEEIWERK
ncbi:MAG: hypothetical protein AABW47_00730 [Nanoarchaeota archaeon]